MATTKDRYILEVDTARAQASIDKLNVALNNLGGAGVQQKIRSIQQAFNGLKVDRLVADITQLKTRLDELGRTNVDRKIKEISTSSSSASSGLKALAAAAVAAVAAFAINKVIDITARYEDLRSTLDTVTGSVKAGGDAFKFIKDFASQTQFGVEELTKTYIQLRSAGIEPTSRLLKVFADTASVTTDQLGSLEAMTALLARTTGGGLGIEELDRLAERGIPVFKILKEEMGLSRDQISKFGQSAEGATKIVNTLMDALERDYGGATAKMMGNLSTVMSNLGDAVDRTIAAFGSGLSPAIKEIATDFTNFLNANEELAISLGKVSGEVLRGLANSLKEIATALNLADASGLQTMFGNLIIGLGEFITAFQAGIKLLLDGLTTIGNAWGDISNKINGTAIIPAGTKDINAYLALLKDMRYGVEGLRDEAKKPFFSNPVEIAKYNEQLINLDRNIAAIEAGNYFIELENNVGTADTATAKLGERITKIGEDLKTNAQFPFYSDAIVRAVEAQDRLAEATANAGAIVKSTGEAVGATAQTFEKSANTKFYENLIQDSQAAIDASGNLQNAMIGLDELLAKGMITPDLYAEAVRRVNEQMASQAPLTYLDLLNNISTAYDASLEKTAMTADAQSLLTEQYSNGNIKLAEYAAGITTLGGSFDAYLLSIGDTQAYLDNLMATVDASIEIDARKMEALSQLTAEFERGQMGPELYRQMVEAMGFEIDTTTGRVRALMTELELLTASADEALASAQERIRAAQEQAELSGYQGVERALRAITLEEERLRDATIERLRTQALANNVSEADLNAQIARIEAQTTATIAARQAATRTEESNAARLSPTTGNRRTRTPTTPAQPKSMWDTWFGGTTTTDTGGGIGGFGAAGTAADPLYVIPTTGAIEGAATRAISGIADNVSRSVENMQSMTRSSTETNSRVFERTASSIEEIMAKNIASSDLAWNSITQLLSKLILKTDISTMNAQVGASQMSNFATGLGNTGSTLKKILGGVAGGIADATGIGSLIDLIGSGTANFGKLFAGFFATGGSIPAGRYGIVGENGPERISGPATITPMGGTQVTYNINAVDAASFTQLLARNPAAVHAVVQRAQSRIPGSR